MGTMTRNKENSYRFGRGCNRGPSFLVPSRCMGVVGGQCRSAIPVLVLFLLRLGCHPLDAGVPTLSIDGTFQLKVTGSAGSFHTLLRGVNLDRTQGWQVFTNVTLDVTGKAMVQVVAADDGSRFFKLFAREGLVAIPPGTFVMGSPASEKQRSPIETRHTVILTKGFWMGQYEVTQGEYLSVVGSNPSYFRNGITTTYPDTGGRVTNDLRHPVEQVSWMDATNYCEKLTRRERVTGLIPAGYAYRLPTESEWEYACRAGTTNAFSFGTAIRGGMANFNTTCEYESSVGIEEKPLAGSIQRTVEVGNYQPNAFGLYDMHGNVWEWCSDWYGTYSTATLTDPLGPKTGDTPVCRGGGWDNCGYSSRAAMRAYAPYMGSSWTYRDLGFRVVLSPLR